LFAEKTLRLQASRNGHHLVTDEGKPFFWLADTGRELFHRLNRDETEHDLATCKAQGLEFEPPDSQQRLPG